MRKTILLNRQALVFAAAALFAVSAHAGVPLATQPPVAPLGVGFQLGPQGGVASVQGGTSGAGLAGLKFGYTFNTDGPLRPALEYDGYWVRTGRTRASASANTVAGREGFSETFSSSQTVDTRANTCANLVNGLVRLDLGRFQPYAGVGFGVATSVVGGNGRATETDTVTFNLRGVPTTRSVTTGSGWRIPSVASTRFAAQAVAGADYYVTRTLSVFGEYKYLDVRGSQDLAGLRGSLFAAGVRFHF